MNLAPTDMSPAENTDEYSRQTDKTNRFKTNTFLSMSPPVTDVSNQNIN